MFMGEIRDIRKRSRISVRLVPVYVSRCDYPISAPYIFYKELITPRNSNVTVAQVPTCSGGEN